MPTTNRAREAVKSRWSQVSYRKDGSFKEQIIPTIEKKIIHEHDVITIESESESETDIENQIKVETPFKLMRSSLYDDGAESEMTSFEDILGDKTLKETIMFSFQYDLEFLFTIMSNNLSSLERITMVGQTGTISDIPEEKINILHDFESKLNPIFFYMPKFTCHHSKMIINIYHNNSMKIYLPSSNSTRNEAKIPQQVCWESPILSRSKYNADIPFQRQLVEYLETYCYKSQTERNIRAINSIIKTVRQYDFTPLKDVTFIFSSPHSEQSGLKQLKTLRGSGNLPDREYLCQVSSIGSVRNGNNLLTHTIIPIIEGVIGFSYMNAKSRKMRSLKDDEVHRMLEDLKISARILFPTMEEVRSAPMGWLSGGWFHFHYAKHEQVVHDWQSRFQLFAKQNVTALKAYYRQTTPSHSKFYMRYNKKSSTTSCLDLDWCIYTSANLSNNAWGHINGKPRNYEVGVLYKSGDNCLRCVSLAEKKISKQEKPRISDKTEIKIGVPFILDIQPYSNFDEPYCMSKTYEGLIDSQGRLHEPC